jgi:hypothetical protein
MLMSLRTAPGRFRIRRADRIRAVGILAKYGLGTASDVTVDQVRDRLGRTVGLACGIDFR